MKKLLSLLMLVLVCIAYTDAAYCANKKTVIRFIDKVQP